MSAYTMNDVANQIAEAVKALAVIGDYKLGVKQTEALHHAESVLNAASLMIEAMAVNTKCQKLDSMIETIEEVKTLTEACETTEVKAEASPTPVRQTEWVAKSDAGEFVRMFNPVGNVMVFTFDEREAMRTTDSSEASHWCYIAHAVYGRTNSYKQMFIRCYSI